MLEVFFFCRGHNIVIRFTKNQEQPRNSKYISKIHVTHFPCHGENGFAYPGELIWQERIENISITNLNLIF